MMEPDPVRARSGLASAAVSSAQAQEIASAASKLNAAEPKAGVQLHDVAGRDHRKRGRKTSNSMAMEKSAILPDAGGSNSAAPTVQSGGKPMEVRSECPPDSKPKG